VRELVGFFAFSLAAFAALALLPVTAKLSAAVFHPHWMAVVAAAIIGFAVVYFGLTLIARWLTAQLHQQALLGSVNRVGGLAVGAVRALIILGLFALVFDRATPSALKPDWITSAFFYPLASSSGRIIAKLAPTGLRAFGHPGALLNGDDSPDTTETNQTGAVSASPPPPRTPRRHRGRGYDQRSRDQLDSLVERTR
jgi:membrane protein required for colicin V production